MVACALCISAAPRTAGGQDEPPTKGNEPAFDRSITIPELFDKAREAFGLNKIDLAEKFYQEILIRETANVRAMLELSNVYERSGKLEYARGLLLRSAKIEPENPAIQSRLASVERMLQIVLAEEVDSLVTGRHYELAIPKISLQISLRPDDPELLYQKAVCYMNLGRPDAALSDLEKAIRLEQKDRYYKLRSAIINSLKQKESQELVEQAKKLTGSQSLEDREKVLAVLTELLQLDPENEWAKSEFLRLSGSEHKPQDEGAGVEAGGRDNGAAAPVVRAIRTALSFLGRNAAVLLVILIVLVLFKSPLVSALSKRFLPHPALSGRFPKFSLSEILLMLNAEHHTGVLSVKGEACRGNIYVNNGEPCHSTVGKLEGTDALVHLLNHTASGFFDFSEGSVPPNRTIDMPLSIILVEHNKKPAEGSGSDKRGDDGRHTGSTGDTACKKPKSRMKELLDSKMSK